ncbi:MAG: STAS domain-containing protein [Solirubrobacterales bacterium]|nr:STAS domain-containing protein [Solirubrobacterales bacterium]
MAELDDKVVELNIAVRPAPDGATLVHLSGELDSSNAERLNQALSATLAAPPERLIFDLSELRFMDSAGIAVLVRAAAAVATVHFREPSAIVKRLIEVTGLSNVLRIEQ